MGFESTMATAIASAAEHLLEHDPRDRDATKQQWTGLEGLLCRRPRPAAHVEETTTPRPVGQEERQLSVDGGGLHPVVRISQQRRDGFGRATISRLCQLIDGVEAFTWIGMPEVPDDILPLGHRLPLKK